MSNTAHADPDAHVSGLYRAFWHFAGTRRPLVLLASLLLVASQATKLVGPWLAAQAINAIQRGGADGLREAGGLVLWIVASVVLSWALHGPGRLIERNVAVSIRRAIADRLFAKVCSLPLGWHQRNHSGETLHRINQTSGALYDFAQNQFIYLQNAVSFVGPVVALWLLSPPIGAAALLGYIAIATVVIRFDHALMVLAAEENGAERRYCAAALDFLGNASTLLSLRLQQASRGLLARRLEKVFRPLRRSILLIEAKWCSVDLLSIGLAWSLVGLYAWLAGDPLAAGTLLIGNVFMVYQYTQQAGGVIGSVAANYQQFARMATNFRSADEIRRVASTVPAQRRPLAADWRRLELHGLTWLAPDGRTELTLPVALQLRRGERIALVGPSGAGKSTLMRGLAGLHASRGGQLRVDGRAVGQPVHPGSVATLVPQEAEVFEASVRENLALGTDVDDEALWRAARVAGLDRMLETWPDGLDTMITERGVNLSGGQKQRLALARGVLAAAGSNLVLLDEPTSSLDPLTERRVFAALGKAFEHACLVASVHRLSLLDQFDRVMLVLDGTVVDTGSVEELAARQPVFRAMLGRDIDVRRLWMLEVA